MVGAWVLTCSGGNMPCLSAAQVKLKLTGTALESAVRISVFLYQEQH